MLCQTLRAVSSLEGWRKNLMSLILPSVLKVYMKMLRHLLGEVSLSSSFVKTPSLGFACIKKTSEKKLRSCAVAYLINVR